MNRRNFLTRCLASLPLLGGLFAFMPKLKAEPPKGSGKLLRWLRETKRYIDNEGYLEQETMVALAWPRDTSLGEQGLDLVRFMPKLEQGFIRKGQNWSKQVDMATGVITTRFTIVDRQQYATYLKAV